MPIAEVLEALSTSEAGLSESEASARLERDGPNALKEQGGWTWLPKLAHQFIDPLVIVLIAAGVISAVLGDVVDAIVIGAVVVLNACIGFYQEFRAEMAIAALGKMLTSSATVVRDGQARQVPSEQIVAGDVVQLQSGDTVPADLRLLETKDLKLEESALTGESLPAEKAIGDLAEDTPLGDRKNLAFAGSSVTYGQGRGVVVAIGEATETGRIAGLMASTKQMETPLTRRISQLSRLLVWIILGVALVLFVIETLQGQPLARTFNAAVALAVGAIPEGLPAAVTILLAVGVSAMARRRALIRRLPAVETLGSTTVICSDKTGTLTENQMTVTTLVVGGEEVHVQGIGFSEEGGFEHRGTPLDLGGSPTVLECVRAGALCSDARLKREGDSVKVEGDPTEGALIIAARKAGLDDEALRAWPRKDVVPFESQHMYMATLHGAPDAEELVLYAKGSSDALLERCETQRTMSGTDEPLDRERLRQRVDELAARGQRVLVIARRSFPSDKSSIGHDDVTSLTLLGLAAMIDPPRAEAKRAVKACREAGITVKMITGDHAVTASAIASELGLEGERKEDGGLRAVTGQELAGLSPEELKEVAEGVAVFARVAPEQKLSLVRALQERGHVVAMTGDGVNDAPALKQAQVGVAMGMNGTDVARGAAAMILTDDNFATIEAAVEEGRGVYDNLVKFIAWSLPTNGGEAVVLLAAMLLDTDLPVMPAQLLWVNMVTAVLLGTALVFEPREPGLMQRPPRPTDAPILDRNVGFRTVLFSLAMGSASFGFFEWSQALGATKEQARTIAVNTIVVMDVGYLFACRSLRLPLWRIGVFSNPWVWAGAAAMVLTQLAFTYLPVMNRVFHSAPIDAWWWGVMALAGAAIVVLAEIKKLVAGSKN